MSRPSMTRLAREIAALVNAATPGWTPAEGRCDAWAAMGQQVLRRYGLEFAIANGPALFTFGPGICPRR